MSRADLLALSPESLAALANLGLVKRAQREIAAGEGPELAEDAAGVVTGRFKDGTLALLIPGKSLRDTPCSCGAVTVCRHRIAVILAYSAWHAGSSRPDAPAPSPALASAAPAERWSPSCFTDAELEAALGKRVMERARALVRAGVVVEIDPGEIPAARLPTCAVRFHVPRDLAYARCDCAVAAACEHVAVAAWAFREGERGAGARRTVELRGDRASVLDLSALDEAAALAAVVLADGVAGLAPEMSSRFAQARDRLAAAGFVWPATLVDDLELAVEAYRSQSARYRAADVADLLAGLAARAGAVTRGGELPARYLLGADEVRETALDHVRLLSLGARVDADGSARDAEVFLADPDAGIVLVLAKRWTFADGEEPEEGPSLERRAVAPRISLGALARGQIVSRAVRRRANRSLVLGASRGGATSVTPQTGAWDLLPPSILSRSYAALRRALDASPPRLLRPRVLADAMRVVAVSGVSQVAYDAGEQQISARIEDGQGQVIRLVRRHRRAGPHALDAIASALTGASALRFVAGDVRHGPFGLEIDPVGLVTDRLIVPDLEPAPAAPARLAVGDARHADALLAAIDLARSLLSEGCHLGLRRARPEWAMRTLEAAAKLDDVGLAGAGRRVRALADRVKALRDGAGEGDASALAEAWASAAIRVDLCREAAIRG